MKIAPVIMAAHGTSDCMWKRYSGNYPVHILTNYAAVLVESAVTSTVSFGIIPNNLSEKRKNNYKKKITMFQEESPGTLRNIFSSATSKICFTHGHGIIMMLRIKFDL